MRTKVEQELRKTLKAGREKRVSVLRMLLSELEVAALSGKAYREIDVIRFYANRLRKNAAEYDRVGAPERAQEAKEELAVVEEFLPARMSREQIEGLVESIIEEHGYGSRDLGRIMKAIMSEHGDVVDGRVAQEVAREKLSERT